MKKLRLTLDDLAVDSFPTVSHAVRPGTVAGYGMSDTTCHQIYCDCPTNGAECPTNFSCPAQTCGGPGGGTETCGDSCGGTCDTCVHSCGGSCEYDSHCLCTNPPDIICP